MSKKAIRLLYFSGTGNSLAVAEELAEGLDSPRPEPLSYSGGRIEADVLGIISPVYFARPPVYVEEIIETMDFGTIDYASIVLTGGGLFGDALSMLADRLGNKGVDVSAGFLIPMPGNHPMIAAFQKRSHQSYYRRASKRISTIIDAVSNGIENYRSMSFHPLGSFLSNMLFRGPYQLSREHRLDEVFCVNTACDSCGVCEKVCPTKNISLSPSTGYPVWNHNCANCAGCYHLCPREAIEFSGIPRQMKRYCHPRRHEGAGS